MSDLSSLDRARHLLKQLFLRHKDTIYERVALLEEASAAATTLDGPAREEARGIAHKLAGSLGTFGMTDGSAWAKDSEAIFQQGSISTSDQERLVKNARDIRDLLEREST